MAAGMISGAGSNLLMIGHPPRKVNLAHFAGQMVYIEKPTIHAADAQDARKGISQNMFQRVTGQELGKTDCRFCVLRKRFPVIIRVETATKKGRKTALSRKKTVWNAQEPSPAIACSIRALISSACFLRALSSFMAFGRLRMPINCICASLKGTAGAPQ